MKIIDLLQLRGGEQSMKIIDLLQLRGGGVPS